MTPPHDSVVFRHYRKCKISLPSASTKAEITMLRLATVRGKRCSAPDNADPKIGAIKLTGYWFMRCGPIFMSHLLSEHSSFFFFLEGVSLFKRDTHRILSSLPSHGPLKRVQLTRRRQGCLPYWVGIVGSVHPYSPSGSL